MADSIYVRLTNIMDDLARIARHVQPFEMQLVLEHIADRLEAVVEETIGMETPHQEEEPSDTSP